MTTAKKGDTVLIDYTVRTNDGRVVGGTEHQGPQTLTIGNGEIFPQVENTLDGMEVGAEESVTIAAAEAFGPRNEEMVISIPRANLPQEETPQPGMTLSARQQDGSTVNLIITEVSEETVRADGNHPLAGQDLHFGLTLVEIKTAA